MRTSLRSAVTAVAAVALLLTVAACSSNGTDGGNDSRSTQPLIVKINISGDSVSPNGDRVQAAVGQPITLDVTSDKAGEIHVHSDPEHEYDVPAGHHTFTFTVDRPGMVAVESHTLDKTVVQLQVR